MKTILSTSEKQSDRLEIDEELFNADDYILRKETEENLKKLANAMAVEWAMTEDRQPDLSFSRFEAALNARQNQ